MRNILFTGKNLVSPNAQGADFVELFFDLVFVYAITGITALTAHHLDPINVLRSILIFWLIWWGWTQFTWALNAANTKLAEIRMAVLIATGVAFVLASSVGEAFTEGVLWFALPYVIIRAIGIGLYMRVTSNLEGQLNAVLQFGSISVLGLIAVMAGAFADPTHRAWWWLGAIALDMLAGFIGGKAEGWRIQAGHFAERHGLIVIIALGESLIVAANAVSSQDRSTDLLIVGGLAVVVTCLLWWSYFAWINEHVEEHFSRKIGSEQAQMGRDAYSFIHFPLVCGIIGLAVGFEKILGHPHDLLNVPVTYALCGGYILFVTFTAASVWRSSKMILVPRFLILLISIAGLFFCVGQPPQYALGIIAMSLILIIAVEWKKCRLAAPSGMTHHP